MLPKEGMLSEIDVLWGDAGIWAGAEDAMPSSSPSSSAGASHASYFLHLEGRVVCLPMILPALMSFLHQPADSHRLGGDPWSGCGCACCWLSRVHRFLGSAPGRRCWACLCGRPR